MPILWIVIIVLILGAVGYFFGRKRAITSAGGDARILHSLPSYYGTNVSL
ncbi:MAG: phosphate transport system permease protein, partial [Paracoccaceae bacterium]